MAQITVTPETNANLKQYAQEKGITVDEAADRMIDVAVGRLSAIRKDAKRRAAGKPPTHRKVTVTVLDREKAAAKVVKSKKEAKAKKAAKA